MTPQTLAKIAAARERVAKSKYIVAFTGAGISAESGLDTFRGDDGLWNGVRPEDLATQSAFRRDPKKVWSWYNWRRAMVAEAKPNPGHLALAAAEKSWPRVTIITQNVDRLHQVAGSSDVIELHGNIHESRCTKCGLVHDNTGEILDDEPVCDDCGKLLRPNIVWFGENLPHEALARAWTETANADIFLIVGTSGVVQPAAGLVHDAKRAGAFAIEVNLDMTGYFGVADISIYAPAGEVLPLLFGGK